MELQATDFGVDVSVDDYVNETLKDCIAYLQCRGYVMHRDEVSTLKSIIYNDVCTVRRVK
jgi:hypothetical protein